MKKCCSPDAPLVWSSELGRVCPDCGKASGACSCLRKGERPEGAGVVRVRRESKGRGGKMVTVISGLPGADSTLGELAGALKRRCGSGGTVKDGNIEIQGDQCDLIISELTLRGFKVKRAGG